MGRVLADRGHLPGSRPGRGQAPDAGRDRFPGPGCSRGAGRAADVLAFFDHPGSSNGPTEVINGRLEHLRGTLGFRNLAHYITRSLLDTGAFRTALHPHL